MTPVVLRSPEAAARSGGVALVAVGWAVAAGAGGSFAALLSLPGLVLAWRMRRNRVEVHADGIVDVRTFRSVLLPWDGVTGFDVNRPGGLWAGFCVRALETDVEHDLLGVRAYSRRWVLTDQGELHRIAWTLEELRRTR